MANDNMMDHDLFFEYSHVKGIFRVGDIKASKLYCRTPWADPLQDTVPNLPWQMGKSEVLGYIL